MAYTTCGDASGEVAMHGMHARKPKNFVLEERLERYAAAIELEPARLAGRWAWACHPLVARDAEARYRELWLDLGCGKGAWAAAEAATRPDTLFVCVDAEPICIAYAAQKAVERRLANMVLVAATGAQVAGLFAAGEVDRVVLNFPTPYPRRRDAWRRLTVLERLLDYRRILARGGCLALRTDSQPLRDFTLTQLGLAGYELRWSSDDAREARGGGNVSEYEAMTSADGASVLALEAVPAGDAPPDARQTEPLSLVDYLPAKLDAMGYVPRGMQGTVTNLRNRAERERRRAARGG